MIRYTLLFLGILCQYASMYAQKDTSYLLPTAEVAARRIDYFSIGQTSIQSDSQSLSLFQNHHLSDLLQTAAPLNIRTYGTGLASLSIRGLSANNSAILWNGINLQNPLNGGLDLSIMEVGTLQRVNIILGGSSALYGSGAIAGIISLENTKPKQTGIHTKIGYSIGSFGWQNNSAQLDFGHAKISASVRVSSQKADNNFIFRNTAEIGKTLQRAANAAYNLLNINANLFIDVSKNDFLKLNFWRSSNYREIMPTMTAASDNAIYRDTSNRFAGEWLHLFKKSFLKIRGAYLYDNNFFNSNTIKNSQNGIYSYIGEAEWNYNFSKNHFLRAGFNLTDDHSDNNNYVEKHQRTRYALCLNDVYTTDFVTITANVRQEAIKNTISPTTFSTGFEKPLPLKIIPNALTLKGSVSRNFNVPSFNDLFWANLGNPNLKSEQGWSKELGLNYNLKKPQEKFDIYATFFDINIKNKIVWLPQTNGQWKPDNVTQIHSRGVESGINYRISRQKMGCKLELNYQFAHTRDNNGRVPLHIPAHKGNFNAMIQYHQFYATWQQSILSKRYSAADKSSWADSFTNSDATVGFTPSLFKQKKGKINLKSEVRFHVTNVFNTDYQVIRFYPTPKRQYRLAFLVGF
jgi:vitamin B12 transporter